MYKNNMTNHYDSDDDESYHDDDDSSSESMSDEEYPDVDEDEQLGNDVKQDSEEDIYNQYDDETGVMDSEIFGGGEQGNDDEEELFSSSDNEEDEDEEEEQVLQKIDAEMNTNYLIQYHPESVIHNEEEVALMCRVVRDAKNNIIDELHHTLPYLTKYEKTRILGQRAKQINEGSRSFIEVPEKILDGYLIAELELKEKRIPFIIRRPLPNGGCEYWRLRDLEIIDF